MAGIEKDCDVKMYWGRRGSLTGMSQLRTHPAPITELSPIIPLKK